MHKNNILKLYRHIPSGEFLRLVKIRDSGVNTYLQVDCNNQPIIKKRCWSVHPTTQSRIVKGFDNMELWEQKEKI
jgi:hypothetical protein